MRIGCSVIARRGAIVKKRSLTGPKKAANLSINVGLLKMARKRKINLSATLEEALLEKLRAQDSSEWLAENEKSMDEYADHVRKVGVFSDRLRRF
jgi:antitoxin CcdA